MAKFSWPWQQAESNSSFDTRAFVAQAYELVLQREPDESGLNDYVARLESGELDVAALLTEMGSSAERQRLLAGFDIEASEEMQWYRSQRDESLESKLRSGGQLGAGRFAEVYKEVFESGRELIVGQADYAPLHRARFEELFDAVAALLADNAQGRLLEFGVSEFSGFYKRLWPALHLELSDRPTPADYPGFNRERSLALSGAAEFYSCDLQSPSTLAGPPGDYDVIVCAEVLEHLLVDPGDLLGAMISLLADDGVLYLTTPNFFSRRHRQQFAQFENPQELYPTGDGNWDAHHHHREYGALELLRQVREKGWRCRSFHYSSCWDPEGADQWPEWELGNLVFALSR